MSSTESSDQESVLSADVVPKKRTRQTKIDFKSVKRTTAKGTSKRKTKETENTAASSSSSSPDCNDDDAIERELKEFDLNYDYGPCCGLTRLERWNRAYSLGLKPPKRIKDLLMSGKAKSEALWSGTLY